ncbi:CYFA0S06e02542g1_1 [Cyberlindnera fabianii]|uniref:CYFA0S06e02542g1_1 n=1 Tax=Cyberlindnera fabianii TaxID=36022 RepID=A0A061B0I1_CYBFA|nr:hypothetical protein BON22_3109 [Cyberlindnera fabianii]CDR41142.1 CYFA0S06e02542g1_1 [Cyberlindnera fabianii]
MAVQTRKSTRSRVPTTKAKQNQETIKPSKPVLRSISTIDDNENTYNNVNFKRRRLASPTENSVDQKQEFVMPPRYPLAYNTTIDDDDNEDDLFNSVSDEENIFNSEDDDYYSAISDYESDSKSRFIVGKPSLKKSMDDELHSHMKLSQTHLLSGGDSLFDTDESESDSPITPVTSTLMDSFSELKSLEANFQKIADENQHQTSTPTSPSTATHPEVISNVTIEDCLNYQDSLDEISEEQSEKLTKQKFLHYRHDERHNLAFPDVSTFPVRYDPLVHDMTAYKKMGATKRVRALKRRAILSGKASEMVVTGVSVGDFML